MVQNIDMVLDLDKQVKQVVEEAEARRLAPVNLAHLFRKIMQKLLMKREIILLLLVSFI